MSGAKVDEPGSEVEGGNEASLDKTAEPDERVERLSKNAQKKLLKQQRYEESKAAKKAANKVQKQQATETKKQEVQAALANMSEEQQAAWRQERREIRDARKAKTQDKRSRLQEALQGGQRIVVDLSSAHLMSDIELKSMCQQIAHSYSYNVRAAVPCSLHLCSLQGRMQTAIQKQIAGFENWSLQNSSARSLLTDCSIPCPGIHRHEAAYDEVFREQLGKIVYLTADSEMTLERLEPDEVYIIGGIVDRNRFANMCLDQAAAKGIRTAKLPIAEHVKLTGSRILTVNHVVNILVKWIGCGDWKTALLESIPARKRTAAEAGCEAQEDDLPDDTLQADKPPSGRE